MNIKLAWGARVPTEFAAATLQLCRSLAWGSLHPSWLMACMHFESGGTFSPSVRNAAGSGATGLIQFMPSTARGLHTTTDDLARMTAVEQLRYVGEYFRPYAPRIHSLSDLYMAILLPKYVGHSDDSILFSHGIAYRQNSGLDTNRDGTVTKREATARVQSHLVAGMLPANAAEFAWELP